MVSQKKGFNIYIALLLRLLIIYLLYTLSRTAFYYFNASSFSGVTFKGFFTILLGGLKFDNSALLYINSLFIASQIVPFKFKFNLTYQKVCSIIFFVTNGIGLALNFGDIAYYPFTLKRTTFSAFSQFSNESNLGSLFLKFIVVDYWYITVLFIFSILAMIFLYKKIIIKSNTQQKSSLFYSTSLAFMLLSIWCVIAGMRGGFRHSTRPITISNAGEFVQDPSEINIVINTPFSILRTIKTKPLKKQNFFKNEEELNALYNPIKKGSHGKDFKNKNVVVILLESFSREYVGALNQNLDNGNYKGYTPFLDSLINVSLTFDNAYANGRKSIEGLPSSIASIPGINEPFILGYYSGNKINSFGNLLSQKGYHTSFFHGAPNGSMGFSSFVKLGGITNYFGKTEYNNDADFDGMWGIWDEPFLQYMAKELNNFKQPFFSSVFTLSSHHPFKLPKQYEGKFDKGTIPVHQNVGYSDMALKKFFQTAAKSDWFKNTIFVITADHSSIAWHPEYKTPLGAYAVPIIIYEPSGNLKGRISYPVQQIDILPTILNYLNYDKPYFAFGNDMINRNENDFVINTLDGNYQLIKGDYFLQWNNDKEIKLFNYKNDILLKNDISKLDINKTKELETLIHAFIQQYNKNMIDNTLSLSK